MQSWKDTILSRESAATAAAVAALSLKFYGATGKVVVTTTVYHLKSDSSSCQIELLGTIAQFFNNLGGFSDINLSFGSMYDSLV